MELVREPTDTARGAPAEMRPLGEVLAVLKLALTFRLDAARLVGHDATIALLGLASLAVWAALDWLRMGGNVQPDVSGLPGIAAFAAAILGLAWLIARFSRPPLSMRKTLWLVAGYLPAAVAVAWLLSRNLSPTVKWLVIGAFALHMTLYFWAGLRALAGAMPWRAFGICVLGAAALAFLGPQVQSRAGLWTVHKSPEQVAAFQESTRRAEEILYSQDKLLGAQLASLSAADSTAPRVYFVGFAGYGNQRVFGQEILLAQKRVDERYGIGGRSVLLINDQRDYDSHPLASPTGLARAIRGVAERMDRDNDLLFLALSSHGRRDSRLVVTNGALPLNDLTGAALDRMLDESGIRWRVLVVSACYGASFIEPLRDEYTAIITAAAPDKQSFGCNDRRELTYFGEAFYRDALPGAPSLRAAFDKAVAQIDALEKRQGLVPSQPQAFFGAQIERKLQTVPGEGFRGNSGVQPVAGTSTRAPD
jgi:hypothetical protein